MISVLNNQHVAKRSRQEAPRVSRKYKAAGKRVTRSNRTTQKAQVVFSYNRSEPRKPKEYGPVQKTLFTLLGILFLIFTFSTSLLFSLSRYTHAETAETANSEDLFAESHLGGAPEFSINTEANETNQAESNIPEYPREYTVKPGDSLYSISKQYDISLYDLLRENHITEPRKLAANSTIRLPKNTNKDSEEMDFDLTISANATSGFAPFKTRFSVENAELDSSLNYLWVFGNDTYGYEKSPEKFYQSPGTYQVYLVASKEDHQDIISNSVFITVRNKSLERANTKSSNSTYITLSGLNEKIDFNNLLSTTKLDLSDITVHQNPPILEKLDDNSYKSVKAGYSKINITAQNQLISKNIFVSPYDSVHSQDRDFDWYKTQFATGVVGNCGPSCVAMARYWSQGKDVSVAKIRQIIGIPYQNGGLDWKHLEKGLGYYGIPYSTTKTLSPRDLRNIIDRGNIAIVSYDTESIKKTQGDPVTNLIGRYYNDQSGHYIIVKGYTKDFNHFIVYDPIPSDWKKNDKRYGDGETMLGKNRYYPSAELFKTMKREVIEVKPQL
ncbi:MAG: LysM peptidoglycan-binding domain-containing protein [Spirochaetales bacterium]|nr:LysM peptidoglycan-binding domain-containing protein [Spirochaetales bacterium]